MKVVNMRGAADEREKTTVLKTGDKEPSRQGRKMA